MKPPGRLLSTIAVMLGLWLITGCQVGMLSYSGMLVPPERMTALETEGEKSQRWQGTDLVLDYRAHRSGDRLRLEGQVTLSQHLTNYDTIEFLDIQAHFLDGDGRVMASHLLYAAGYRTPLYMIRWTFSRDLKPPDRARAIAFSYQGKATSGGGSGTDDAADGSISWDFWQSP